MSPQAVGGDDPLPSGALAVAPVDVGRIGEACSIQFTAARTGVHWFEVRYPSPREAIDARVPGAARKFGQPHHEAFGGKFRVAVTEVNAGAKIVASQPRWTPMEIAVSNQEKTCADRLDFPLREGVEYQVRLMVDVAAPALQTLKPRFVVEASDAARHGAETGAGWGRVALGALIALGVLLVAAALVRFLGGGAR